MTQRTVMWMGSTRSITSRKRMNPSYLGRSGNSDTLEQRLTLTPSRDHVEWGSLPETGTLGSAGHWNEGTSGQGGWVKLEHS